MYADSAFLSKSLIKSAEYSNQFHFETSILKTSMLQIYKPDDLSQNSAEHNALFSSARQLSHQ